MLPLFDTTLSQIVAKANGKGSVSFIANCTNGSKSWIILELFSSWIRDEQRWDEAGCVLLSALARLCPVQHSFRISFFFFFPLVFYAAVANSLISTRWSNQVAESAPTTPSLCNSFVASHKKTQTRERRDKSESVNTKLTKLTGLAASTSSGNSDTHKLSGVSRLCCSNQWK